MKFFIKYDIVARLLALFGAIVLWFYAVSALNPEKRDVFLSVPVTIEGVAQLKDAGLVIIDGLEPKINVTVSGRRDRVVLVTKDKITARVSVAQIVQPDVYNLKVDISINVDGVMIESVSPVQIKLTVDRVTRKAVPIQVEFTGTRFAGYSYDNYSFAPDLVTVEGPESLLEGVDHALVVYDIENVRESVEVDLPFVLCGKDGEQVTSEYIRVAEPSVTMKLIVRQEDSVPLVVDITPTDRITADMVLYDIDPATVLISGDPSVVSLINHIHLGTINLAKMIEEDNFVTTLPIILPNGVTGNANLPPATITVTIPGLTRAAFSIPRESWDLAWDVVEVNGDALEVAILASDEELALLTAEQFTILPLVALDQLSPGVQEVPVAVLTNANVTIVGKYVVSVTAPEPPEETEPAAE